MSASRPQRAVLSFPDALSTREAWLEPFPWYTSMRRENPVRYDPERECWDVFRYTDVETVLGDRETFSSNPETSPDFEPAGEERPLILDTILTTDPPRHDRLRSVVDAFFRPGAVGDMAPHIAEITADLLQDVVESGSTAQQTTSDDVAVTGRMDVVADLAYPLPVIVIAEMLGVPPGDRDQFKAWSDTVVRAPEEPTEEAAEALFEEQRRAQEELADYFGRMVERRRADPRDDLITRIIGAEVDGKRLDEREILGFCMLLLIAGNITTTNLITNAVRCFADHSLIDDLAAEPAAIPGAIEEVLRYRSPVQAVARIAMRSTELAGCEIEPGDGLILWLGSANRDEAAFDSPDEFRPDRSPNRHLAFGHGIHYCLGAPLARLEARLALSATLERLDDIRVVDEPIEPVRSSFIYGLDRLPIRFGG